MRRTRLLAAKQGAAVQGEAVRQGGNEVLTGLQGKKNNYLSFQAGSVFILDTYQGNKGIAWGRLCPGLVLTWSWGKHGCWKQDPKLSCSCDGLSDFKVPRILGMAGSID